MVGWVCWMITKRLVPKHSATLYHLLRIRIPQMSPKARKKQQLKIYKMTAKLQNEGRFTACWKLQNNIFYHSVHYIWTDETAGGSLAKRVTKTLITDILLFIKLGAKLSPQTGAGTNVVVFVSLSIHFNITVQL